MNCNKELNLTQSKSKAQWWRMGLIWGVIVTFGFINSGCNKDNEEMGELVSDEYYVKYEVNSTTIYTGGKLDVTINTEKNNNTTIIIDKRTLWETVIGPVQKGFNATIKITSPTATSNQLRLYTNIYVSKNGSPFALKKNDGSDTPRDSVQLNYTIDY